MRSSLRVAISLLITVIIFSVFAVLAFSGLFDLIETKFYNKRITENVSEDIFKYKESLRNFHEKNTKRLQSLIEKDYIKRSFLPNRSEEDIFNTRNSLEALKDEMPGLLFTRFVDMNSNIHFSTRDQDIKQRGTYIMVYKDFEEVVSPEYAEKITLNKNQGSDIIIDGSGNRIVYLLPFYDTLDIFKGTAQFFVSLTSIERFLIKNGTLEADSSFRLFKDKGYIFGADNETISSLSDSISTAWKEEKNELTLDPLVQTEDDEKLYLFSRYFKDIGFLGYILPERVFVLSEPLKIILMVSFFVTTFLLLFLLLSIRQDRVLVLSERIKRFQINFLKEYVENKEQLDWDRWKSELVLRREEVKNQIKRGIGSLKEQEEQEIDGLIDRSWDEIIRVIGHRAERGQEGGRLSGSVEIANIEEVVEKVLSRGNIVLPPGSVTTQSPGMTQGAGTPARSAGTGEETHPQTGAKNEAEEIEEIPATEAIGEKTRETKENVSDFTAGMKPVDVEDVTDAEEGEELDEAEEYEEVEELGEAEKEVEELGEVEEAEELEEVEEVTDLEEVEEKQAPDTEETEEVEELGEAEEIEEIEEAEELGEAEDVEVPLDEAEEVAETGELEEPEELSEAEEVTDLEDVAEKQASEDIEAEEIKEIEELGEVDELKEGVETLNGVEEEEDETAERPTEEKELAEEEEGEEEIYLAEDIEEPSEIESGEIEEVLEGAEEISTGEEETESYQWLDVEITPAKRGRTDFFKAPLTPKAAEEQADLEEIDDESESEVVEEYEESDTGEEVEEYIEEEGEPLETEVEEGPEEPGEYVEEEPAEIEEFEEEEPEEIEELDEFEEVSIEELEEAEMLPEEEEALEILEGPKDEEILHIEPLPFEKPESLSALEMVEEQAGDETFILYQVSGDYYPGYTFFSSAGPGGFAEKHDWESGFGSLDEVGDLEEVEEEREEENQGGHDTLEDKLRPLLNMGKINIVTMDEVMSIYRSNQESIEFVDGAYVVKDDVFKNMKEPSNQEMGALVDSVLYGEEGENLGSGGIDTIMNSHDIVLPLMDVLDEEQAEKEVISEKGEIKDFDERGFLFDNVVKRFRHGGLRTTKALMKVSKHLDAVMAGLLVEVDNGYRLDNSLGFKEESRESFVLYRGEEFFTILKKRMLFISKLSPRMLPWFQKKLNAEDAGLIVSFVLVPMVFRDQDSYLFLGFKHGDISWEDVIEHMNQLQQS